MNKKLLSILIANAVVASSASYADTDTDNFERLMREKQGQETELYDDWFSARGTVGTAFEYEDKVTKEVSGNEKHEMLRTAYLGKLFFHHQKLDTAFTYDLKTQDRQQYTYDPQGNRTYSESEATWVHIFTAQKAVSLGNGFGTGVFYGIDYQHGVVNSPFTMDMDKRTTEHTFNIPLTYYNPSYGMGFYSHVELLLSDLEQEDKNWGDQKDKAYSLLFKPYYRTGNWELGLEMFYQTKDTEATHAWGLGFTDSEFEERYIEPLVTYSFEDAGTLFLRARFGENETRNTAGDSAGNEYYTDILKGTVGYEQAVGDDWLVKAEYEFTKDDKTFSSQGGTEEIIGQKLYVQALYRF